MTSLTPRERVSPHPLATDRPSEPGLLSITRAAKRIGVATRTAYQWAHSGELPGLVRINGRFYVKSATLERFLAGE